ncbi:FAD-dependent oxidoreductase [Lentisphaerota bacterium WC36G]|nr:FAD-dependent oxidoreductase [Lentisphaerae bacterium WC36]
MENSSENNLSYMKCKVCGEVIEGMVAPEICVVCGSGAEAFEKYTPHEEHIILNNIELEVVIIGAGIAAVSAAKAIRERNKLAKIDLYTNESEYPYNRPLLTKGLGRDITKMKYFVEDKDFYIENEINIHFNCLVNEINPDEKNVVISQNSDSNNPNIIVDNRNTEVVSYDKLLIATGAEAFVPPFQGCQLPEVCVLRRKIDLDHLYSVLQSGANDSKNVVIIGGGLLGLETASALDRMGHSVTVIEACPSILPRQLDADGAPILLASIAENSNVTVKYGVFVEKILGEECVEAVQTKDGEIIDCNCVLISAGNTANNQLAKDANLLTSRAINVNKYMQTSNDDIYAAGDCAVYEERIDGIWETAKDQGEVAGANIAGEKTVYNSKPFGATFRAFKTSLFSIGEINVEKCDKNSVYSFVEEKNEPRKIYNKFVFKNGLLVGGVLLGSVAKTKELIVGVTNKVNEEEAKKLNLI